MARKLIVFLVLMGMAVSGFAQGSFYGWGGGRTAPTKQTVPTEGGLTPSRPVIGNPIAISNANSEWPFLARWSFFGKVTTTEGAAKSDQTMAKIDEHLTRTMKMVGKALHVTMESVRVYQQIQMLRNQMKAMEDLRLTVDLYKLIPALQFGERDSTNESGQLCYTMRLAERNSSSSSWLVIDNEVRDNPFAPRNAGKILKIKYPHKLSDLSLDATVWGNREGNLDEEDFQRFMLAGYYDGVTSLGSMLANFGVDNTLGDAAAAFSPKALAQQRKTQITKRIEQLQKQKDLIKEQAYGFPGSPLTPSDATLAFLQETNTRIDKEIARLQLEMDQDATYVNEKAINQIWVEDGSFPTMILSKLESRNRRLNLARVAERYTKYEDAWRNPGFMAERYIITGDDAVDKILALAWQTSTLVTKGDIPPPVPVDGGPAAEAQATIIKAAYRTATAEELQAIRQILGYRIQREAIRRGTGDIADAKLSLNEALRKVSEADTMAQWRDAAKNAIDNAKAQGVLK